MKIMIWQMTYRSFGFILGRDCVLSQFEPYEVVKCWEPHLNIYFGKQTIHIYCEVSPRSWLGRKWGQTRFGESVLS